MMSKVFLVSNSLFLISMFFVILTGCVSTTPPVQRISSEQSICPDSNITFFLQERFEKLKTIKGTAVVNMRFKDGREVAGRAIVIIKRPDKFRFEVLGPFNQVVAVIVYNGTNLSLLALHENRIYKDYLLPVEAYTIPQYLTGLPASIAMNREAAVGSQEANHFQQALPHGQCVYTNLQDEYILINQEGNIKEITSSGIKNSVHPIKVFMDSYKKVDGFNLPFEISISNKSADIFIKYEHVELNQHVSEDLFDMPG